MTLTKAKVIDAFQTNGFSKKQSDENVEAILKIIKDTLTSGEDVLISNFGKFQIKKKRERRGRNPATGDRLMLEPRKVITFKCSGWLRKEIDNK